MIISVVTSGDVPKILNEGHGIPLFNVDRVGPSIAYWAPKHLIMEIDWKLIKDIIIQGIYLNSINYFGKFI
jgi:hypothetical protein